MMESVDCSIVLEFLRKAEGKGAGSFAQPHRYLRAVQSISPKFVPPHLEQPRVRYKYYR